MKKLYFPRDNPTHYWEYWNNGNGSFTVHWGELGAEGTSEVIAGKLLKPARGKVRKLEQSQIEAGYVEVSADDQKTLLIEYVVDGFGNVEDLDKRHSLESLMNEVLGWTGLGDCDGGSIGSDTMEICCYVVNFELAKSVIVERLKNTEFADYSRIYSEN